MSYSITSNKLEDSVNKLEQLEQSLKELIATAAQSKSFNETSIKSLNDVIRIIINAKVELMMSKSLVSNVDFRTNKQKMVINNISKIISQVPDKVQFTNLINDLNNITSDLRNDFNLDKAKYDTQPQIKINDNHFLPNSKSGSIINQDHLTNMPIPGETKSIMGNMTRSAIVNKRFGGLLGGNKTRRRRLRS